MFSAANYSYVHKCVLLGTIAEIDALIYPRGVRQFSAASAGEEFKK